MSVQEKSRGRNTRKDRSVEMILDDVPTIRPRRLSVATMNCQTLVLVRIRCADGIEGTGERTTIGGLAYGEKSPESVKVNIDTYFALDVEVRALCRHASSIREDDR